MKELNQHVFLLILETKINDKFFDFDQILTFCKTFLNMQEVYLELSRASTVKLSYDFFKETQP